MFVFGIGEFNLYLMHIEEEGESERGEVIFVFGCRGLSLLI